ncbi:MAG: TonB-dependent receptor [Paludibaculum sp.]
MIQRSKCARLSLACALFSAALSAQSFTAAVRGTVTDASGAAVPAASVVITETERNVPHAAVSDDSGRFQLTALPPGLYTVNVEAKGFRKYVQTSLTLAVQQQATLDIQLQVGDIATAVEVTSSAALLNTTISNLGQVIENKYILSLPNIGRNAMGLTYMTPGVVGSGGRANSDANTNFVANGSRNSTSDVLLDGVTVVTVEQNSGITDLKFSPSVDAVQEFKMQTNFFSAEYGQTGGAVVNMVTKSGTNEYHGTGYYFLRHSDLNSNNWFSNKSGRDRPFYRRDQLGGVIGGPVVRNKTFFFASYEYTKSKSPTEQTASWPTLLQRDGNFSQTFNGSGQLMTIYNPYDTFTNAAGNIERRPFAGNIVPKGMMDPIALKALEYFSQTQPARRALHRNEQLVRAGHQSQQWSPDQPEGRPQLQRQAAASRADTATIAAPAIRPTCLATGIPAFTFNRRPQHGHNPLDGSGLHARAEPHVPVVRSLWPHLLHLLPEPDGAQLRPHLTGVPQIHEGQCDAPGLPNASALRAIRTSARKAGS